MSVGVWDPNAKAAKLDAEIVVRMVDWGKQADAKPLSELLSEEEQSQYAPLMHVEADKWSAVIKGLDNEQLWQLICFLTIAEMSFPAWRSDEQSPVITIATELKTRGKPLNKEQLLWIRAHSDNRFLPHGKVVG
jgi:hypothetical protein